MMENKIKCTYMVENRTPEINEYLVFSILIKQIKTF